MAFIIIQILVLSVFINEIISFPILDLIPEQFNDYVTTQFIITITDLKDSVTDFFATKLSEVNEASKLINLPIERGIKKAVNDISKLTTNLKRKFDQIDLK